MEEVSLDIFGRRAVMDALHFFIRKKELLEKEQLYEQYERCTGKLINAEIGYIKPSVTVVYDGEKNPLFLPKENQIPRERFHKGNNIKAIIEEVRKENSKIEVILSRTSPLFLKELLTLEIPEIFDNVVIIKNIARIPGVRSKVIVESQDDRVDAAGACIGRNARRIQTISKEYLNNERIDIITYTNNLNLYVKRITGLKTPVEVEEKEDKILLYIRPEQLHIVHYNVPFLQQILNKEIQISTNQPQPQEEDVHLDEFSNEIDMSIINAIKEAGFATAKNVLKTDRQKLIEKTGIEATAINNLYKVLEEEFRR